MANQGGIFCRNYTTAPSLRDSTNNGTMLPIKLAFMNSWSIESILQHGTIQACQGNQFVEQLPEILQGKRPEWILRHVQILPQQFSLHYTRPHSPEEIQQTFPDGNKPPNFDYGKVTAALQEVTMKLTVPAFLDQPEVSVSYQLECGMDEAVMHLGEARGGKREFYIKLCTDLPTYK